MERSASWIELHFSYHQKVLKDFLQRGSEFLHQDLISQCMQLEPFDVLLVTQCLRGK